MGRSCLVPRYPVMFQLHRHPPSVLIGQLDSLEHRSMWSILVLHPRRSFIPRAHYIHATVPCPSSLYSRFFVLPTHPLSLYLPRSNTLHYVIKHDTARQAVSAISSLFICFLTSWLSELYTTFAGLSFILVCIVSCHYFSGTNDNHTFSRTVFKAISIGCQPFIRAQHRVEENQADITLLRRTY